ncbi:MAG: EamA family transporter [SAR324 cluster bacterium]|nr:EamA family transporter [SAR324 cluster bacterium]
MIPPKLIQRISNLPFLLLTLTPLFWSGNIVLARGINEIIPPIGLAFWRWTLALIFLLPFTWKHAKQDWKVALGSWKILTVISIFGISCFNTMLYKAAHTTTAINIALMQSTMPAVIILFSLLLFKEKISKIQMIGVSICMLGAFSIILHGNWKTLMELSFVEGDIWMAVAVVFYALYSTLLHKRPEIHGLSVLTFTFAIGISLLLPFYLWELSYSDPIELSWQVVSSILYVAVFPSIVSYLFWNRSIQLVGANRAGLFINLIPVFASILAVLLLGESLYVYHFAGMILIGCGMFLFNYQTVFANGQTPMVK